VRLPGAVLLPFFRRGRRSLRRRVPTQALPRLRPKAQAALVRRVHAPVDRHQEVLLADKPLQGCRLQDLRLQDLRLQDLRVPR
jgi:hypothetical protein